MSCRRVKRAWSLRGLVHISRNPVHVLPQVLHQRDAHHPLEQPVQVLLTRRVEVRLHHVVGDNRDALRLRVGQTGRRLKSRCGSRIFVVGRVLG